MLVLDDSTAMTLVHYLNSKLLKSIDYPISTGKEAMVFRATSYDGKTFYAVKAFKYETSAFVHMADYIEGDPRFRLASRNQRDIVREWTRKEFANLRLADKAKAPAPKPIAFKNNVVIMEFLGQEGVPYAHLQDTILENPQAGFKQIISGMRKLFINNLVHGDLSPYNILVGYEEDGKEKMYFIDLGQGVLLEHPRAKEFLLKDCDNIARYFKKYDIATTREKVFELVTGKTP